MLRPINSHNKRVDWRKTDARRRASLFDGSENVRQRERKKDTSIGIKLTL
jgi:hypothetical protein